MRDDRSNERKQIYIHINLPRYYKYEQLKNTLKNKAQRIE